jgi:hypothetical protein
MNEDEGGYEEDEPERSYREPRLSNNLFDDLQEEKNQKNMTMILTSRHIYSEESKQS